MGQRESFSVVLKKCRARLGLTQLELAQRLGMSVSNIKAWEQGKQLPRFDTWKVLNEYVSSRSLENAYVHEKGQKNE